MQRNAYSPIIFPRCGNVSESRDGELLLGYHGGFQLPSNSSVMKLR